MAHLIDMTNNRENMAYVGKKPWHGLGQELTQDEPLKVWLKEAGMNWDALSAPVEFQHEGEPTLIAVPNRKVIYRSDTLKPLGVVGHNYQIVQPAEVLEFYRSLVDSMGYKLETAGVLMGGKRVWALAKTGEEMTIKGQDRLEGYVLLATSYDGSMATVISRTSVRVVCWNTLSFAIGSDGKQADVRIPHSAEFNAGRVKKELGLESTDQWNAFSQQAEALSKYRVSKKEAISFFLDALYPGQDEVDIGNTAVGRRLGGLMEVYTQGVGQGTVSAAGTAWGLVNAVTRYTDHERRAHSQASRLNSAWFGQSETMKRLAFTSALEMVA